MPTFFETSKSNNSTKLRSKFSKKNEPKVLTKFDAEPQKEDINSILNTSFKSDLSDSTTDDELKLIKPIHESTKDTNSKFEPKKYDGFQIKILPTKEKVLLRNKFMYLDSKSFSIVWTNVYLFFVLHSLAFFGIYKCYSERKLYAFAFSYLIGIWGGLGITAGAHRLWSHRSYKARLPLRIFLMIGHTIAGQNNLYVWCRDHRVHHKFSETDADPHNSLRGFFFAHMGWLLRKKHPEVVFKGATVPMDDILADPVIKFNMRYYYFMYFAFALFLPTFIGAYFFNEGWWYSFLVASLSRYVTSLHSTWFVNSAAHMFGDQPYNVNQRARENPFVSLGAFGEGYHNYHHTFPFDYSTSELSTSLNLTKYFIDLMAFLGLAYDLKRVSRQVIDAAMSKTLLINERKKICAY